MTFSTMLALFGALALLAAVPSLSVFTVSARAATYGFGHGAMTAAGVVAGDVFFIVVAIFGLTLLVDAAGGAFVLIRYAGGAYLVWLGISLWRAGAAPATGAVERESSLLSSFMAGLLITLGDQKAIFFYLGFFPAFLDLSTLSGIDAVLVVSIAVVAVGGIKLGYAYAGNRAKHLVGPRVGRAMNAAAGGLLVAVGLFLVVSTSVKHFVS